MTIRIPLDNALDTILKLFGKKRKIILPQKEGMDEKTQGPYVTLIAKKESFWKALFNNKKQKNGTE